MTLLEYESLKAVIQYMEANLRISLSQRLPSIQRIDKILTFKVEKLHFNGLETTVNDTVYQLGIYRKYEEGEEIPKYVQMQNFQGGHKFYLGSDKLTPGDVLLIDPYVPRNEVAREEINKESELRRAERSLKISELVLADRRDILLMDDVEQLVRDLVKTMETPLPEGHHLSVDNSFYEPIDYKLPRWPLVLNHEHPRFIQPYLRYLETQPEVLTNLRTSFRYSGLFRLSIEEIEHVVEKARDSCQFWYSSIHNIPLPYTNYLQLTIRSPRGTRIQRTPGCRNLTTRSLKRLNTIFFGSRDHPIRVKDMIIDQYLHALRLPEGVRFEPQRLEVGMWKLNRLSQVIISKVQVLSLIHAENTDEIFQNQIICNSKKLILENNPHGFSSWVPTLIQLQHEKVELKFEMVNFRVGELLRLVQHWQENGRPLGTVYSFGFCEEDRIQFISFGLYFLSVVLQMTNNLQLSISYRPISGAIKPYGRYKDYAPLWVMEIKVEEEPNR